MLYKTDQIQTEIPVQCDDCHSSGIRRKSLHRKGLVQLKPLMSRHFPFRAFHDAYVYIDENREKTMKVLIDVDDLREDNLSPASGPDLKPAIDHI